MEGWGEGERGEREGEREGERGDGTEGGVEGERNDQPLSSSVPLESCK